MNRKKNTLSRDHSKIWVGLIQSGENFPSVYLAQTGFIPLPSSSLPHPEISGFASVFDRKHDNIAEPEFNNEYQRLYIIIENVIIQAR